MRKCIVFDFDGSIHRYSKGWQGGEIYDPVDVTGILLAQERGFAAAVVTARAPEPVYLALRNQGLQVREDPRMEICFWNDPAVVLVTNRKIAAAAYLDDRAVFHQFGMSWSVALDQAQQLAQTGDGWSPSEGDLMFFDGSGDPVHVPVRSSSVRVRSRSCPACGSSGIPKWGCQNLWHVEVRP